MTKSKERLFALAKKQKRNKVGQALDALAIAAHGMSYADMVELASDLKYAFRDVGKGLVDPRPRDWAVALNAFANERVGWLEQD